LQGIVAKLGKRDGRTFNFKVYLTREINAFAIADGSIRVFSGLMDLMNDRELLFVIGHEMGHVLQDHSRKKKKCSSMPPVP
jgi:putative metalloprotease